MEEDKLILMTEPCCNDISTCDCNTSSSLPCQDGEDDVKNVENNCYAQFSILAAVLQDSVMHSWKMHLKAKKYSVHVILEEYYNEAFDMIDAFIEHCQGLCNCIIVDDNITINMIKSEEPVTYFTTLKDYIVKIANDANNFNENNLEIKSDIDDIIRLIDSTLYKLNHLTESKIKSFDTFVYEDLK